jgi:tetratricopeptide (TPR) repeat protein
VLAELGGALNSVGEHAEALTVFEELGTNLPEIARKAYATALYKNNNLEKAQALIDDLLSKGSQPDWALALAVDIALRQENHEQALKYLTLLSARGATTTSAELVLCQCLLETGQDQAALLRLERLVKSKLSPVDRMNAASLLQFTGQEKPALNLALQAFRQGSTAPNLHRALITIALRCKEPPLTTNQVADCTHVRLVSSNGEYRDHVVFSEGPWDPVRRLRKIKFLFRPNRPFDTTCFHD